MTLPMKLSEWNLGGMKMKLNDVFDREDLLREKMELEWYDDEEEVESDCWPYGRDERWNESWF